MKKILCLPDTTFARGSESNSLEELEASRCSGTLSSTRFSVNSSSHSGRSRDGSLRTYSLSFLFGFLIAPSFPSERTAGVSSRSFMVTKKSNSLTYTVASSFVCTSLLAVTTVVGFLRDFYGIQFSRVEVFPADHMLTCSGVHHKLFFLRLYCGWQTPPIGR